MSAGLSITRSSSKVPNRYSVRSKRVHSSLQGSRQHLVEVCMRPSRGVEVLENLLIPSEDESAALLQALVQLRRYPGLPPRQGVDQVFRAVVLRSR
mmetsp:Transcript_5066/g.12253  ORF Transcript_5066/g.12253 Transcript_5066/m.12253 type:complete len:96 (+) Transcript_5066:204-491(+)